MKFVSFWHFATTCGLAVLLCGVPLRAQENGADETFMELMSQQEFPTKVTFEYNGKSYELEATGAAASMKEDQETGKRIATFVVAHYMEKFEKEGFVADFYKEIVLKPNVAKQITLHFNFNVPAKLMHKTLTPLMERTARHSDFTLEQLQKSVTRFMEIINLDIAAQESLIFRWFPEGKLQVVFPDGETQSIDDASFAAFFWQIWFGFLGPVDRSSLVERANRL